MKEKKTKKNKKKQNDCKRNIRINKTTTTTLIKLVNKTENPFKKKLNSHTNSTWWIWSSSAFGAHHCYTFRTDPEEYIAAVQPHCSRSIEGVERACEKKLLRMGGQEQVNKEKQSQVKDFVLLPKQGLKWTVLLK